MRVTVEFHGVLRQLAGADEIALTLADAATVEDACDALIERYPELAERLPRTACALGDALVPRASTLDEGQRLVLIPPVSGG